MHPSSAKQMSAESWESSSDQGGVLRTQENSVIWSAPVLRTSPQCCHVLWWCTVPFFQACEIEIQTPERYCEMHYNPENATSMTASFLKEKPNTLQYKKIKIYTNRQQKKIKLCFYPVQNPEKSCTLTGCCQFSFSRYTPHIWTAHVNITIPSYFLPN